MPLYVLLLFVYYKCLWLLGLFIEVALGIIITKECGKTFIWSVMNPETLYIL